MGINDEQALRYVILNAFNYSPESPYTTSEELSSGRGFADIILIPYIWSDLPAIVIELKWNKTPEKALRQIKDKNYSDVIKRAGYKGSVLLIGANYSETDGEHTCEIEERGL